MSLVHFVENDNVVIGQHGIGRDLPQHKAFRDEADSRRLRLCLLEADLVADLGAVIVERLVSDAFR